MSTISKLSIRGIRSFGTKSEDEQVISFNPPLTLILGPNGCGKTTIIECLKYALTGEMPPGSNKGQSFVHDPKIFQNAESLGQVKLKVKNIRKESMTVTRSMKVAFKRGKWTFETLDNSVLFEADGQKDAISKRCIDTSAEMCHFMGVSKAIINNVIFCHQEDSNWPLEEAKKLKEKFDAIFGTTEYNKTIEKIIKMRKGQMDQLKVKEANLKLLIHLKKESESKTLDLQTSEKKLEKLQATREKYEEDTKPIQQELDKIYKIEMEIGKLQSLKIELVTKLKNCSDQGKNLESKIKKVFVGDLFDLDKEIRSFKETMNEKRIELEDFDDQLQNIKIEEKKLQTTLSDLDRKRTTLVMQRQQEQECLSERAKKLQELCTELNIKLAHDLEEKPEEVPTVIELIKTAFKNKEKEITDMNVKHEKEDHQQQVEIDKYREKKATIESDISSKNTQKTQLTKEQRKIQTEINAVEASAQTLKTLTKEIEKINEVYNNYSQSVDLEEIKTTIAEKRKNVDKLQENLEKIDEKLTFLNSISKFTAEINLKTKELEKRDTEVQRVKSKHSDNLKKIFPERAIETNFKRNVQTAYENLQKKINDLNKNMNTNKIKEKELQMTRKNRKDELTKAEKDVEQSEETIFEKCCSVDYKDLLAKSKENIEKLQLDHGAFKSSEAMYKRYIQKIEEDPRCPLCHTNMSGDETIDLTSELSDEIHRLPENIKRTEEQLMKEQTKYEDLLQLKPIIEKVERLKIDIPKMKLKLKDTEEKMAEVVSEIDSLQKATTEPNSMSQLASSMLGDMSLLDEAIKDVTRLKVEVDKLKTKLPEGDTSMSVDDAQLEKCTIAAELKSERTELDKLQTKYDKESETLNKLREKRNNLKDRQIKHQEGVQALSQLKTRDEEISTQIDGIAKSITEFQQQLEPLKQQLSSAIETKQKLKDESKKNLNKISQHLDRLKKIDSEIQRLTKELNTLAQLNLVREIEKLKTSTKRYMEELSQKNKQNENASKKIENLKSDISNQEILERDLKDNRELIIAKQKETELQSQYNSLTKDMGDLDYKNVSKQKDALIRKRDEITIKKGEILGQMGEVNNQINSIRNELNKSQYKDSLKNYRKNLYEVEITKKLISDLGNYRVALESGLMKFHSEKMQKINKLIREFWRHIYRGNDIDYIQIQTDELKADASDRKRSYNYRVVQSKNNMEIDMRGRCSAGQRVLACLIIRMALAETFSANCGVLALDEPTTNLDKLNIASLCDALNQIVEERQTQSNFMLLVITHDEEFIQTLGRIQAYHKVYRSHDGKSIVRNVKVANF